MGAHAYATANAVTGHGATSFVWSNGAVTNRAFLNDGRMDKPFIVGSSVASGVNVIVDVGAGSAVTLVAVAVLNSNCAVQKTDATLKVEASSSSTFAADVNEAKAASTLYSTLRPRNKDHLLQFPETLNKRYWRLTWTWTGNVTNFQVGELFFVASGSMKTLARRTVYGSGETFEAVVATAQMQYGETRSAFHAGPVRQLDTAWEDLNASERDELYSMHLASNFGATPLLWAESQEATATAAAAAEQECLYGRIQAPRFSWSQSDFAVYRPGGIVIRSLGREAGS